MKDESIVHKNEFISIFVIYDRINLFKEPTILIYNLEKYVEINGMNTQMTYFWKWIQEN